MKKIITIVIILLAVGCYNSKNTNSLQFESEEYIDIIGVFDSYVARITSKATKIDIINGQLEDHVIIDFSHNLGNYNIVIYNCTGKVMSESSIELQKGILKMEVPPCGVIKLSKNTYL